jgi:hypothetical protein
MTPSHPPLRLIEAIGDRSMRRRPISAMAAAPCSCHCCRALPMLLLLLLQVRRGDLAVRIDVYLDSSRRFVCGVFLPLPHFSLFSFFSPFLPSVLALSALSSLLYQVTLLLS